MNLTITYHCTLTDEPIILYNPDRLLVAVLFVLESKVNHWEFDEKGYLQSITEQKRISRVELKSILEIPDYLITRVLQDIRNARRFGFDGGRTVKEKTFCKLNRLVKLTFEMQNDRYLNAMEERIWDYDFEVEMRKMAEKEQYDWEEYSDQIHFFKKHKLEFCRKYEIVGLAQWYQKTFPTCSRQTMKRDFDVLNETGSISIRYIKEDDEYDVINPWVGWY